MINNLHITVGQFQNASRILKQTASLLEAKVVSEVLIIALHEGSEKEVERLGDKRSVRRIRLRSRGLPKNIFFQFVKFIDYCWIVVRIARKFKTSIVNVHSVFALPLGVIVAWVCGATLVYDPHELETEAFGKSGLRKLLSKIIERSLIGKARLTIVVGDLIEGWYRDKYKLTSIVTVMNCPLYQRPKNKDLLRKHHAISADKKILLYQGGLWAGRGIEGLLDSFAAEDDGKHVLVLMGFGELEKLIKQYANKYGNIFLQPAADPTVVLQYTACADYGIAYIDNPSLNDQYCLPNKFFEYIMAGLPILVNDVPEMKRIVGTENIGIVLSDLNTISIKRGLAEIEAMDQDQLRQSLKRAAEKFCWEKQELMMLEAYKNFAIGRTVG